jgi:two-component system chemotaxis sensor kinase CheA
MTVSDEFVRESTSQLRELSDGLIAIEQAPGDAATLDEAFRTAHSLKGNCAMAGLEEASAVAHAVEDVLSAVRTGEVRPEPDLVDAALDGTDAIESLVTAARDGDTDVVDHEPVVETLRETLAARREADADADPVVPETSADPGGTSGDPTPDDAAEQPDDLDADVLDALDTAAEYDDLDELLAAMDDEEGLDEMPDLPEAKDLGDGESDGRSETPTEASADDAEATSGEGPFEAPAAEGSPESPPVEDDADAFASVQAEVAGEESDLEELQAEIDAVSFGEFDEDDDLSIEELVAGSETEPDDTADGTGGFHFGEDRSNADDVSGEPFGTDEASAATAEADAGFDGSGPFASPDEGADTADAADTVDDADAAETDPFASVQAEVAGEESDLEELQAEIDAVSFGEFDEDDDLSIEELVAGSETEPDDTADAVDVDPVTPAEADVPPVPTVPDDLVPAVVATDDPTPSAQPSTPTPPEQPADLTPVVTPATDAVEVPARPDDEQGIAVDETPTTDYAAMDWRNLQRHAADRSVYRPGMTRAGVEAALAALDAGADVDAALAAATDAPATAGDEPAETPTPPEQPADLTPAVTPADDPVEVPVRPGDGDEQRVETDGSPSPPTVPDDLTPAVSATSDDAMAPPVPETPDDLDVDSDAGLGATEEPALDADVEDLLADSGFDGPAGDEEADGPDEPGLDPDVDDLLDSSFEEREADVEFARDTATEAFEDRFGRLFGAEEAAVTRTVTSLAESSAATLFADPADERDRVERDRVQSITVDVENAEALLSMVEELTATRFQLEGALEDARSEETVDALSGLQSVTANLRKTVMDLRLMPFETATRDLQRLVRDTARAQDKRVSLDVSGREVGLDRSVIDRIGAPLVHIVRNAVDHGIESPGGREAVGKDPQGTVEVRAERARDGVVIEIEDDGRGIDVDAVRQRVVDNDLLSADEAADLPAEELYPYVFEPGFSTAEEVTDVSGRGVGMDVVDRVTSDLGGSVEVESTPGEGTTVRLRLPITVAVAEVMFVQSGEERYGIPVTAIEEVEPLDAGETDRPLVRLAEALDTPGTHAESGVAVRLRPETRDAALHCDRVVETREVVIRPFEGALGEVPGVSGATLLGDGELVNIIDVATI